ncbi:MAG: capsular polysaccharide biosynthesis protein [Lachnospiraceae bacterium]|nr:capsular polysaccharide biosynthesis protein [Lachnospiraceae bacterium]
MIDWHSHVLPGMDDGSRNVEESLILLEMLADQKVDTVIATPHFHANDESVSHFLDRRAQAIQSLQAGMSEELPRVLAGAEVRYYRGISRMEDLKKLCIQGSKLLLLEMPMSGWTEYTVKELVELSGTRDLTLILAHMERYLRMQSDRVWSRLYDSGILMQVNAGFFIDLRTRRKALSMLRGRAIHLIGSDCHNVSPRPPRIGRAFEIAEKRLGRDFINHMNECGQDLLVKIEQS